MTARSVARRHEVSGWVRNEADGSVLMEVQGMPREVEAFLDSLRAELGRLIGGEASEAIGAASGEASFEIRR